MAIVIYSVFSLLSARRYRRRWQTTVSFILSRSRDYACNIRRSFPLDTFITAISQIDARTQVCTRAPLQRRRFNVGRSQELRNIDSFFSLNVASRAAFAFLSSFISLPLSVFVAIINLPRNIFRKTFTQSQLIRRSTYSHGINCPSRRASRAGANEPLTSAVATHPLFGETFVSA